MDLILPTERYKQSYIDYVEELGDENRYPFVMDFDHGDFSHMLAKINDFSMGVNLPSGFVQSSTYWLIESGELVGVSNIRHRLNQQIRHCGGHIGLGIRPSYRGRGYGTELMSLSIAKLNDLGVSPIHIHCYKDNVASAKAITGNGGVLTSELVLDNQIVQRYVVTDR
ncbi:GNAT family N-acetyltransferase [Thalassotalea ponticola]|uniref:GNAT family N-acetyltransferase n=1 Tax=Thalassotalea ponticola TaxID=1523392 RepID=UPI0025B40648|nr:GNAT family N-acetyltransferase [Thalassotalea ponticola]MDN3652897.1 GNAT family N-acetyltransferase [Thalassotalea ponticola]